MAWVTTYLGQVNSPNAALTGDITDADATIPVTELGVFPAGPNLAVIGTGNNAETILYTDKSAATGSGNLTGCSRGYDSDGTYGVAAAWLTGETIARTFTSHDHDSFKGNLDELNSVKAPIDSPTLTGVPAAPTAAAGTNTTQIATTAFVQAAFGHIDAFLYKGAIDCSGNPNYPAADAGHVYLVSAAGKIGGASGPVVEVSDMVVCRVDSSASGDHATVGVNWSILQKSAVDEGSIILSDVTTNDTSTTQHGFAPKAVAPAAGILNVFGIANGETAITNKAMFDTTNPAALGTAGPGTQVIAARRDHIHTMPTLDGVAAPTDVTTLDASTTAHGLILKATAPAAGIRNVVAIDNTETAYKNTALVDDTNPAALGTVSPGTSLIAARRDHVHTMPTLDGVAAPTDVTTLNVSSSAHGLCPKFPNNATTFFRGDGTYAAPPKAGVLSWSEVTGTTQACAVNVGYILNHATTMIVATLPSTAAVGDVVRIVGKGAAMWKVAQNASQYIRFAGLSTTTGTGGYLQAENAYDCVELICTTANNGWTVISSIGNIVVV